VAQANVKLTVDASQATRALKGVQAQSTGLQNQLGRLKTAFAGVALTVVAKQAVSTASDFQALQLRMKVLTSEFGEFAGAQELVRKAQDRFNLSIIEATKGITDIFARLRPLGVSLKDIETTFIGFNTIAKLAGLNATEASAAFTQLAQGLGSGRLQGDEFRSIAEQVPQLLKAISDETGIAAGKLKDFASKGLLTSDVVLRALAKSAEEGADKIGEIMDASPAEVFKKFNNAVLELQLTLGNKLLPTVLKVTKATAKLIEGIVSFVDSEIGQVTFAFIGIATAIKGITIVGTILITQITAMKAAFLSMSLASAAANGTLAVTTTMAFATAGGFAKATAAATAFKIALAKTGIGLVVIGLGFLIASIMKANKHQREFNDLLEKGSAADIKKRIDDHKKSIESLGVLLKTMETDSRNAEASRLKKDIEESKDKLEDLKIALESAEARELAREFETIKKNLISSNAALDKNNIVSKELTEQARIRKEHELAIKELEAQFEGDKLKELKELQDINTQEKLRGVLIKQNAEKAKELNNAFKKIGEDIGTGITDALVGAIEGTRTLGEAARSILNDLASSLLRLGINAALTGLFGGTKIGGFLGFANGGRPPVGKPSIVGERGPEIFVPRSAGTIIPNNAIGGGGVTNMVTINVDATGSAVEGNEEEANEFGSLLAVAIQGELVKQQRPGGILSNTR